MTKFIIRRILMAIPILLAISLATFLLVRILPGGPFDAVGQRAMPQRMVEVLERRYGLDEPIYIQYFNYLTDLIQGDFGPMLRQPGRDVNDIIAETFPVSIQLGVMALILGYTIGIPMGIVAALKHNTVLDYSATMIAVLGVSIPNLVLGPVLMLIFGVWLKWLPIAFWGADPPWRFGFLPQHFDSNFFIHAIIPVFALGTGISAGLARLTRAGLLEVLSEDYIRTARAKGVKERFVILIHALKNSMIPVVTSFGPLLAAVLTGTLIIELIFAINGMGRRFIQGIGQREYFMITSLTMIYSVLLITGNILVDIIYAWLDPRIRYD